MHPPGEGAAPAPEQKALHGELLRTFGLLRKGVTACDWDAVEDSFRAFCDKHADAIPAWFADEYVFQAMRLWADDHLDEVIRHFANFVNRAAGVDLVDAVAEREVLHQALESPFEKPPPR
jgi:hypothetical protein